MLPTTTPGTRAGFAFTTGACGSVMPSSARRDSIFPILLPRYLCDAFDLKEEVLPGQARLHRCTRRPCILVVSEKLPVDLVHLVEMSAAVEEHVDLDDILEARPGFFENGFQICEALPHLGCKIPARDLHLTEIGRTSGNEHEVTNFDCMSMRRLRSGHFLAVDDGLGHIVLLVVA